MLGIFFETQCIICNNIKNPSYIDLMISKNSKFSCKKLKMFKFRCQQTITQERSRHVMYITLNMNLILS